jgi:streptogramin lyase
MWSRCQRLPLMVIALLGAAVCVAERAVAQTITEYGPVNRPLSITTGPDGALWFTENGNPGKIGRITTAAMANHASTRTTQLFEFMNSASRLAQSALDYRTTGTR